jgi:hypothetical protein
MYSRKKDDPRGGQFGARRLRLNLQFASVRVQQLCAMPTLKKLIIKLTAFLFSGYILRRAGDQILPARAKF